MTPDKISKKGHGHGYIFWVLNANSSEMAKDTNFRFGIHARGKVPTYITHGKFSKTGRG